MQLHRDASIRQKLTGIIMLTCGCAVLAACTLFAVYEILSFRQKMEADLAEPAEIIGQNAAAALVFNDADSAREILASLRAKPHVEEACIYDLNGSVFAKYSRPGANPDFMPPPPASDSASFVSGKMLLFREIHRGKESIGTIYLKSDLGALYTRGKVILAIALAVISGSLMLAYLLAARLQGTISLPILELARIAFTVSTAKDYSLRAVKKADDEIGFLFDRFNGMLDQIQSRDAELVWARDKFEERVGERTRELQKENAERKRAEQNLEERTTFLNSLIENCPVALVVVNLDQTVQMCNPAFEHIFRYRAQDAMGVSLKELIMTPTHHAEAQADWLTLLEGQTYHKVTQRRRRDESLVDVEVFGVPLGPKGNLTGVLLLYQDITERRRAEEALLRAKGVAEAANHAKSEFLANMSHEIRTPMNGIIGMTGLALETDLTTEQREYLVMVKSSADSLLKLINDILDFSKIEAGKLELDTIDFALHKGLGETLKTLGLRAHEKGVELAWRVEADVPEFLSGDISRLRQIIVNLVGNALKFTEHGEVLVEVAKEREVKDGILLHFKVKDSGIGIAPEKQKLIFQAFTQADGSTTRKYGGTGLGLTITAQIVGLMGGEIWVESELGRGSTIHFTAQFGIAKESSAVHLAPDPRALDDTLALIVDDNETNRIILVDMLLKWGMRVESAENAEAAISILKLGLDEARPFALIITDLHMPLVDGFGLVEALKRDPLLAAIPIVFLTSSGQPAQRARSRELGVVALLTKPVQPSELLDAVLGALSPATSEELPQQPLKLLSQGKEAGMKVLLAEDNAVNRTLAKKLLEKHGHAVVLAENGRQALETLDREDVDMILMDVQMPVMDGLEAIALIRKKEAGSGTHLPIIALTAHAMKGDRERCLAAGADDYLTKPIHSPALFAALGRIRDSISSARTMVAVADTAQTPDPTQTTTNTNSLDLADALQRVEGDNDLLEEIARIFVDESAKTMAEIRDALSAPDAHLLEQLAHRLKGSSSNLGATFLAQSAGELEIMARARDLRSARLQFDTVKTEVRKLLVELDSILRKVPR